MRIGEVARQAGVSVRALRYYEQQGLLDAERGPGGQRRYEADAVERVQVYQQFYAAGLSSRRIADLLPCLDTGITTSAQRAMLNEERARLTEQIAHLHAARDRLDQLIDAAGGRAAREDAASAATPATPATSSRPGTPGPVTPARPAVLDRGGVRRR